MENILKSIEKSLEEKNWYSALVLSLIIPDICGKCEENNKSSSERYPEWFNTYLGDRYKNFLSGSDCYALRCAFLHEGSNNIEKQRSKEILDHFIFIPNGSHCNRLSNCYFGDKRYDGKNILQLSVYNFCTDIIGATRKWLSDESIVKNFSEMLEINDNGFSIGNAIKFK